MTNFIKKKEIENNWLLIDAENAIVGRLAAYISTVLRGKNKNQYTPHMDNGDFVVVTNIEKIKFTGKKFYNQEFEQKKKVKIPKSLIKTMHQDSISCMKKNPNDKYHKNACECVHWNSHFGQNSMTLHTHTIPKVDYPSQADITTTNNLGKENLCIINVSDQTVTCYNKKDNFQKITQQDTY